MKLPSHPDILKKEEHFQSLAWKFKPHLQKIHSQLPTHSFTTSPKHPVNPVLKQGKSDKSEGHQWIQLSRSFPWKAPTIPSWSTIVDPPEAPCPWPGRRRGARSFLEGGGKACRSPLPPKTWRFGFGETEKPWVFHGDYPRVNVENCCKLWKTHKNSWRFGKWSTFMVGKVHICANFTGG